LPTPKSKAHPDNQAGHEATSKIVTKRPDRLYSPGRERPADLRGDSSEDGAKREPVAASPRHFCAFAPSSAPKPGSRLPARSAALPREDREPGSLQAFIEAELPSRTCCRPAFPLLSGVRSTASWCCSTATRNAYGVEPRIPWFSLVLASRRPDKPLLSGHPVRWASADHGRVC